MSKAQLLIKVLSNVNATDAADALYKEIKNAWKWNGETCNVEYEQISYVRNQLEQTDNVIVIIVFGTLKKLEAEEEKFFTLIEEKFGKNIWDRSFLFVKKFEKKMQNSKILTKRFSKRIFSNNTKELYESVQKVAADGMPVQSQSWKEMICWVLGRVFFLATFLAAVFVGLRNYGRQAIKKRGDVEGQQAFLPNRH